jgi:hypothetical protein
MHKMSKCMYMEMKLGVQALDLGAHGVDGRSPGTLTLELGWYSYCMGCLGVGAQGLAHIEWGIEVVHA